MTNDNLKGIMYTSTDLKSWTQVDVKGNSRFNSVIWNEERDEFMAVGRLVTGTSKNGVDWDFNSFAGEIYSVAWGNGKYVIGGSLLQSNVKSSIDGITWQTADFVGGSLSDRVLNVSWNGNEFVLQAWEMSTYSSKDGQTWTKGLMDRWTNYLNDATYIGNDQWIAVGLQTVTSTGIYITGPAPNTPEKENEFKNEEKITEEQVASKNLINAFILQDATTKALRIDKLSVVIQEKASEAISQLDIAIQMISDERAKFGVYENSLNHIYNNSTNYSLNIQNAESRIRDTDMAKELMSKIRYTILSEVSQIVFAQSNQSSQQVLQILR